LYNLGKKQAEAKKLLETTNKDEAVSES